MTERDRDELLSVATDRFERRMADECGKIRGEMGDLRNEMGRQHLELTRQIADVRLEVAQARLDVSQQFLAISDQFGTFRTTAEARHNELLKWAFLFWLGQALVVAVFLYRFASH